jgi:hypothetical protein
MVKGCRGWGEERDEKEWGSGERDEKEWGRGER